MLPWELPVIRHCPVVRRGCCEEDTATAGKYCTCQVSKITLLFLPPSFSAGNV